MPPHTHTYNTHTLSPCLQHWDCRTGAAEVRRSRRLVVSQVSTFMNYEYAMYWYFYQVGGGWWWRGQSLLVTSRLGRERERQEERWAGSCS